MIAPVRDLPSDAKSEISTVVRSARARIAFYADHLAEVDGQSMTAVPTFDKRNTAGYGRFPLSAGGAAGAHRVVATSGTTGDRLYVAFDRHDWDRVGRWLQRVGRDTGLHDSDVLLNTHCYGLWVGGPVLDLLAFQAGACVVPLGPASPAGVLHMLAGGVGTAISATPSYLRRLIEAAEAAEFDLRATGLRLGFIGAEAAEPALRRMLLSRLPEGFKWVELYGLTETFGPSVAYAPDPDVPELTLNTDDYVVEVLDPEVDAPISVGKVGELTLTSRSTRSRSPLVRYRTRDLVRITAGEPGVPTRISPILGRVDDALKIGGVLMYPSAVADIITGMLPASAEWCGTVHRVGQDDELVLHAEASTEVCSAIEGAFKDRVGLDVTVVPADAASLIRSREKTRRVTVNRDADTAAPPGLRRTGCT